MNSLAYTRTPVQIVSPEAYLAQYREFLARYSPAGWDLRETAPADVEALPEGPDEESEKWWSARSNEDDVILDVDLIEDEDMREMFEAGRSGYPWL